MKIYFIISLFTVSLYFPQETQTLPCNDVPELNKQIIEFVQSKIKKKVGRGECWDLAAEALNSSGAKWDGKYKYGKEVDYRKDCIYPGDMVQFEGVKLVYIVDGATYTEKMAHHTAVIHEVKGNGEFILAHQNTGFSGRKVGLSPLDLKTITKGKLKIYRPMR